MFLGLETIDEQGLKLHRKRVVPATISRPSKSPRELGLTVALNIIADPDWDEARFATIREWALTIPEIVHLTVNTPYPGTETWLTESRQLDTLDYRLFDVQHAVIPTRLPLERFYGELVKTQAVLRQKHLGFSAIRAATGIIAGQLLRGQTNFATSIWKFNRVYSVKRQLADHARPVTYTMTPPKPALTTKPRPDQLYVHMPVKREAAAPAATEAAG
jgi:hopanoid C-3 methylase